MAKTFTSQQLAIIREGLAQEKTLDEIAPEVGCKAGSIRSILKDSGYRVRIERVLERITPVEPAVDAAVPEEDLVPV